MFAQSSQLPLLDPFMVLKFVREKFNFWKMSGKTDLRQGKIKFPVIHAKNLPILGHQVPIFSFFAYTNLHATVVNLSPPRGVSIYN